MNCYKITYRRTWDNPDSKPLTKLVYAQSDKAAKDLMKKSHPGYLVINCKQLKD